MEPLSTLGGTALGRTAVGHTKFQQNPSNGSTSVTSGRTAGYDEASKHYTWQSELVPAT